MRNTALWICFSVAVIFGQDQFGLKSFGEDFGGSGSSGSVVAPPVVWNAPDNAVFYDHPLLLKEYGFGVLGSIVGGALGFYLGNAFESGLLDSDREGYLSFTGIHFPYHLPYGTGPFWGGGAGILAGSVVTAFFFGETDEEHGSIFWTTFGGLATTAAAFELANLSGVQHMNHNLVAFIPLLTIPTTGAVVGYNVSRWFNDKERRKITEPGTAVLLPPRLAVAPSANGMIYRLDALNLSF